MNKSFGKRFGVVLTMSLLCLWTQDIVFADDALTGKAPQNEKSQEYIDDPGAEPIFDKEGHYFGFIPLPFEPELHVGDQLESAGVTDSRYDMRDPDNDGDQSDSLLSPVRDQGQCGSAALGTNEGHLLQKGKNEDNTVCVPVRSGVNDFQFIKQEILDHGALTTSIYWDHNAYAPGTQTYFFDDPTDSLNRSNHAVIIVGWDDNRYVPGAGRSGAFIVRNSWGQDWGDGGYFYASYYDESLGFTKISCFEDRDGGELDFNRGYARDEDARKELRSLHRSIWAYQISNQISMAPSIMGELNFYSRTMPECWLIDDPCLETKVTGDFGSEGNGHTFYKPLDKGGTGFSTKVRQGGVMVHYQFTIKGGTASGTCRESKGNTDTVYDFTATRLEKGRTVTWLNKGNRNCMKFHLRFLRTGVSRDIYVAIQGQQSLHTLFLDKDGNFTEEYKAYKVGESNEVMTWVRCDRSLFQGENYRIHWLVVPTNGGKFNGIDLNKIDLKDKKIYDNTPCKIP